MGFVLDTILREDLIGSRDDDGTTNYESINSSGNSESADASRSEGGYLLSITYDNGVGNDVDFFLEGSLDGVSYAPIPDTSSNITDADGSITWDVIDSNTNFVRITWTVNSGSMDIYGQYSAKRRH